MQDSSTLALRHMASGCGGWQSGTWSRSTRSRSNCSQAWRSLPLTCEAGTMNCPLALRVTTLSACVPLVPPAPTLGGVVKATVNSILTLGIGSLLACGVLLRHEIVNFHKVVPDGFQFAV